MKIKMRSLMAGPAGVLQPGQVADLDKAQAYDLIERRFADQVEEAVRGPAETADLAANRRQARK